MMNVSRLTPAIKFDIQKLKDEEIALDYVGALEEQTLQMLDSKDTIKAVAESMVWRIVSAGASTRKTTHASNINLAKRITAEF